jgi:hypothetical protein
MPSLLEPLLRAQKSVLRPASSPGRMPLASDTPAERALATSATSTSARLCRPWLSNTRRRTDSSKNSSELRIASHHPLFPDILAYQRERIRRLAAAEA